MKVKLRKAINTEKTNNLKNGILIYLFIDMINRPFEYAYLILFQGPQDEIISSNLARNKLDSIGMDT